MEIILTKETISKEKMSLLVFLRHFHFNRTTPGLVAPILVKLTRHCFSMLVPKCSVKSTNPANLANTMRNGEFDEFGEFDKYDERWRLAKDVAKMMEKIATLSLTEPHSCLV